MRIVIYYYCYTRAILLRTRAAMATAERLIIVARIPVACRGSRAFFLCKSNEVVAQPFRTIPPPTNQPTPQPLAKLVRGIRAAHTQPVGRGRGESDKSKSDADVIRRARLNDKITSRG